LITTHAAVPTFPSFISPGSGAISVAQVVSSLLTSSFTTPGHAENSHPTNRSVGTSKITILFLSVILIVIIIITVYRHLFQPRPGLDIFPNQGVFWQSFTPDALPAKTLAAI
jgi:hypothetical protein